MLQKCDADSYVDGSLFICMLLGLWELSENLAAVSRADLGPATKLVRLGTER